METRIVTDSNAMLPEDLRARFDITVVPLTVVVDGRVTTIDEAATAMLDLVARQPGPLRVGVGDADAPEAATALRAALAALHNVEETVRYIVGPSVAAHTGAGTFGAVFHPLDLAARTDTMEQSQR